MHTPRLFFYIGITLVILAVDSFGFLGFFKGPLEIIPMALKRTVFSTSRIVSNFGTVIFSYPDLQNIFQQGKELKAQNLVFMQKVSELQEENTSLRKQLEAPVAPSFSYVPAHVIGVSRFMEIDQGRKSGIEKNMAVVSADVFIGKIYDVEENRSLVILPQDAEIEIPAKTLKNTHGKVGGISGITSFTNVLQKDPLFKDDVVATSGEGGFPPNLVIGTVAYINIDETSVYKQATVQPAVAYEQEKTVFVITKQ